MCGNACLSTATDPRMPTPKMDARDAWLASSTTGNARRRASGGLDYKKFDKIVDSDDEDESRKPQPPAQMPGMPPELKLALAKVEAAKERGDQAGTMLAMAELEARLQDQPADLRVREALHAIPHARAFRQGCVG